MYWYRLGHVPELSLAELAAVKLVIEDSDHRYARSKQLIDIQTLGGIAYVAEDLSGADYVTGIAGFLESTELKKKFIGVVANQAFDQTAALKVFKNSGAKKIAFIRHEPSIGDVKRSQIVFLAATFENIKYTLRIVEYFNQDIWAKLEAALPVTDMDRGQINLKLARTMLNFTTSRNILDPFCGTGRNIIAGLDFLVTAGLSDSDLKAITDAQKNVQFAQDFLKTKVPTQFQTIPAEKVERYNYTAIVSEGWLGTNFKKTPSVEQARESVQAVLTSYADCFIQWDHVGIKEVVLSAPYYLNYPQITEYITNQLRKIAREGGYQVATPGNYDFIHYFRPNNTVGHLIFKLQKIS